MQDLEDQGVTDMAMIRQELAIFEYREKEELKKIERERMGIKPDPYEQSLKLEKNSMYLGSDDEDGPGDFGPDDFEGVETLFSK